MKRTPMQRKAPLRAAGPAVATVKVKKPKTVRCKAPGCRERFEPLTPWQILCTGSVECATAWAEAEAARKIAKAVKESALAQRREAERIRLALEDLEPLQYWLKKAEKAVNRYVRARDHFKGCISCHMPANYGGKWNASHFRSVAAASRVRYHLWNIHKACVQCNKDKGGNISAYRPRLVELIMLDRVEWLESQNGRSTYRREYLERMASVFNRKAARSEKRNARATEAA